MPAAARKVALTDRSLQALRPAPGGARAIVWDALLPGLAVRVSGKGKRSFYAVKRRAGAAQPSWVLLGHYPVTTLAEARAKAREALGALMEGHDPATLAETKRRAREEAERQRRASTFAVVAEDFIARFEGGRVPKARGEGPLRDPRGLTAVISREFIPSWGASTPSPISAIRRSRSGGQCWCRWLQSAACLVARRRCTELDQSCVIAPLRLAVSPGRLAALHHR
jgi:hypothetical protein